MDEFEKRLKEDAAAIRISASPELRKRIAASLEVEREYRDDHRATRTLHGRLWWLSSVTGLAAALAVIMFLNWNPVGDDTDDAQFADVPSADSVEAGLPRLPEALRLNVKSAELTEPLEVELERLQSDIDKARRSIEQDVSEAF